MPRIYKGQPWEVKYRKDVRSITDGLTASRNGRGPIKATQLMWSTNWVDPEAPLEGVKMLLLAWSKDLPWLKKSVKRNLDIIRKSVQEMEENHELDFKEVIKRNAHKYDLAHLANKQDYGLIYQEKGIDFRNLVNEEFLTEEYLEEDLNNVNIKLTTKENQALNKIARKFKLNREETIKELLAQADKLFNSELKPIDVKRDSDNAVKYNFKSTFDITAGFIKEALKKCDDATRKLITEELNKDIETKMISPPAENEEEEKFIKNLNKFKPYIKELIGDPVKAEKVD